MLEVIKRTHKLLGEVIRVLEDPESTPDDIEVALRVFPRVLCIGLEMYTEDRYGNPRVEEKGAA